MKDLACTDTWRRYKIEILRRSAPQNDILSFAFNRHGNSYRVSWTLPELDLVFKKWYIENYNKIK